jgi:hypothetical protein
VNTASLVSVERTETVVTNEDTHECTEVKHKYVEMLQCKGTGNICVHS